MQVLALIVALCAALIVIKDARHWRTGDPRHASLRTVVVSVLILLGLSVACQARPSPYPPVTQFNGDRYAAHAQMGADVAKAIRVQRKARYLYPTRKRPPVSRQKWRHVPIPAPRPLAYEPYRVEAPMSQNSASNDAGKRDISLGAGAWREAGRVFGGRPRDHRGRLLPWCGWYLGKLLGLHDRKLWLARNWATVGTSAGGPRVGAVVVWRHHVGIITGRHGNQWVVKSGNDGHRVRERPRSIAGAIAFRSPSS